MIVINRIEFDFKASTKTILQLALLLFVFAINSSFITAGNTLNIFVSPSGSDSNPGTISSPFLTINNAQAHVRQQITTGTFTAVTINLRAGTYTISKPIFLGPADGGNANCTINYKAYGSESVIISGGASLPKKWTRVAGMDNVWKLGLTIDSLDLKSFNQLFANGQRLQRCRSQILFTAGPIKQFSPQMELSKVYDRFNVSSSVKNATLLPFCSFASEAGDVTNFSAGDISDAEILLYHSWDCSWHKIFKIDKGSNSVYLKTIMQYPVGFFANKNRYVIENCKQFLTKPATWYFDSASKQIFYKAKPDQNPNTLQFVVPRLANLLRLNGGKAADLPVSNVTFTGINFNYTIAPRGINSDAYRGKFAAGESTPWLDFTTGFSTMQGDVDCGQAILLQNTNNISFQNCNLSNLGSYGFRIDKYANNNSIKNCSISNTGGGGIIVGYNHSNPAIDGIPMAASPDKNVILNCTIHNIGLIYKSSYGVGIMNATNTNVIGNKIYDAPYSGISTGWSWGYKKSYTYGSTIKNNEVYNVLKELTDGGGIYTLGIQHNTIISGNIIHDIKRAAMATGSYSNGIFFDEGSSEMTVTGNRIYNIQNQKIRLNIADSAKINWGPNILK